MGNIPAFPTHIQIQTSSFCGSRCSVCPHSRVSTLKPQGVMEEYLFKKIIDECSHYKPERIIPYLMADPMTDQHIFERISYIRQKIPSTCIEISTTANKIDPKILDKLFSSPISELRISSFGITREAYRKFMPGVNHSEAIRNIKIFIDKYNKRGRPFDLFIVNIGHLLPYKERKLIKRFCSENDINLIEWNVFSRAENVDLNPFYNSWGNKIIERFSINRLKKLSLRKILARKTGCNLQRDTHWLHILFNGDICLCCMDWKGEVLLGNVKHASIKEVWNSEKYKNIRKMISSRSDTLPNFLCKRCEEFVI